MKDVVIASALKIYRVKQSLPFRLSHVNCYAIKGSNGWSLIDTGLNTEQCLNVWQQFMTDQHIGETEIKGIYLTHAHIDHIGAAGLLQQLTGAPVYISAADAETITNVHEKALLDGMADLFKRNGMPPELSHSASIETEKLLTMNKPFPALSIIEPGCSIQLGDYYYTVIGTPGHTNGHLCFFNEQYGVLFSGDHMLEHITSNISLWRDCASNPLKNYLQSLNSNRSLPCKTVLPAHGAPFMNMEQRIDELEAHHKERLELMKESASGGATAFEVSRQVFNLDLTDHESRFALSETLAHLMFLVDKGELKVSQTNGINIFSHPYGINIFNHH